MFRKIFPFLLSAFFLLSFSLLLTLPCTAQKPIKKRTVPTTTKTTTKATTGSTKKKSTRTRNQTVKKRNAEAEQTHRAEEVRRAEEARKKEETQRAEKERMKVLYETDSYGICRAKSIDLGLSVKWAGYNVGTTHPEETGNYYAWGELSSKADYSESSYKYFNSNYYVNFGSSISGNSSYDVARAQWGYPWRMPTKAEFEELKTRCTWTWMAYRGIDGFKVTGPNGNAIFLPATGLRSGSSLFYYGEFGAYWLGTLYPSDTDCAYFVRFFDSRSDIVKTKRGNGLSIRPVSD